MADATITTACPECGAKGRKVEAITLRSLLSEDAKSRLSGADYRFCKADGCGVVYYSEGNEERFAAADLAVPIFQKSTDPSRLVCYCFEHRVADIEDEVARTGASVVPDRITEKCRQGLDRCEKMNPQGACCLGNVRHVVKAAVVKSGSPEHVSAAETNAPLPDCCAMEATGKSCRD